MPAITRYDGEGILALSQSSGLAVDEVRAIVDQLAPNHAAIADRIQAVVIDRFLQERKSKRTRQARSEERKGRTSLQG